MSSRSAGAGVASLFVGRPVLAVVLNLLIIVAGAAALLGVDVREMPQVDRPVISVRTSFDGAAPETVDTEVTGVLEDALTQLEGLQAISSYSSYGSSRITLELSDNIDINDAANETREIVARTTRRLPDDIDDPVVTKNDSDADPIVRMALVGDLSLAEMTDIADNQVTDVIAAIEGVAEVQVAGELQQEFRVTVDMPSLLSRGLTLVDLSNALATLRLDKPLGDLETESQSILLRSRSDDITARSISDLQINGNTQVGDIAFVQLTAKERSSSSRVDGQSALGVNVIRQSVGNSLAISVAVRDAVEKLQRDLPDGVDLVITADDGVFIERSIHEVTLAIGLAILIVVGVIFSFLGSVRGTLIPTLAIPVALIGSIAAIWIAGFSVNTITLLALVLATGLVVDDAIVVVENVVRRRQQGLGPRAAAAQGTSEVFFAVISTTATLAAVFIPISFLPGQAGGVFAEFGFVLAFCVLLSSFVALTLTPMLAATLDPGRPRPDAKPGPMVRFGRALADIYCRIVDWTLRWPIVVLAAVLAFAGYAAVVFTMLPSTITPPEDRGSIMIFARAPTGASLAYTDEQVRKVEAVIAPYRASGEVAAVQTIVGIGGGGQAFIILRLADWAERSRSQDEISSELSAKFARIPGLTVSARSGNSLGIRGAGRGVQFAVIGSDYEKLAQAGDRIVAAMRNDPTFANPQLSYETSQPQLAVRIDRVLAADLGLSPDAIATTINAMTEGIVATSVFLDDKETDILVHPGGTPINDPSDLENVFARTESGSFIPLSSVVRLTQEAGSSHLAREERSRAVSGQANLGEGVELGVAVERLREIAAQELSSDTRLIFLGEAAALEDSTSGTMIVFGVAFLVVLLVLAAQFESLTSAIVIMLTVPFGLSAAVLAIQLSGGSLNYYSQIGLVMLIGIMAKNGILIVEFANKLVEAGQDVDTAIRGAVRIRLRPVVMTMIATVFGGIPLIVSTGAGAEARAAVGWVIVGGLGFATIFTLFLTPVLYRLIAPLGGEPGAAHRTLQQEMQGAQP